MIYNNFILFRFVKFCRLIFKMKKFVALFSSFIVICLTFGDAPAQHSRIAETNMPKENYQAMRLSASSALQDLLDAAVNETLEKYASKRVSAENVAATLIDLRDAKNLKTANVRGERSIYSASVVKLFYLAAAHRWLETGKIKFTPELARGLKDMIVDSSNDATHYVLDVLTETSGGGELSAPDLENFAYQRNAVNRYFKSLGYDRINVNQKTYCEDLYGRERQFWNAGKNRNMLTTAATARMLAEIAVGKAVSAERSAQMMALLKRDFSGASDNKDDQAHGFTAIALNDLKLNTAKLWSKAGWTSKTRHDAAYIETADGLKFVLVVFTENFSGESGIIPSIAEKILKEMSSIK